MRKASERGRRQLGVNQPRSINERERRWRTRCKHLSRRHQRARVPSGGVDHRWAASSMPGPFRAASIGCRGHRMAKTATSSSIVNELVKVTEALEQRYQRRKTQKFDDFIEALVFQIL